MDGFSALFHWLPFVVGNQDSSKIKCILNRGSDDARCTMQVAPPCQPAVTQTWVGRLNWSSVEFDFGSWGRPQVFVTAPTKPLVRLTSCMWKQPFHGFCVSQFSDGKYVHRLGSYKLVLRVVNSTQEHTWEENQWCGEISESTSKCKFWSIHSKFLVEKNVTPNFVCQEKWQIWGMPESFPRIMSPDSSIGDLVIH